MDLKLKELTASLSFEELADLSDLDQMWQKQHEKALNATSPEEMLRIVEESIPEEQEPRFQNIIAKLKKHYSTLNINY